MRLDQAQLMALGELHLTGEEGNRKRQAILEMLEFFEALLDILNDSCTQRQFPFVSIVHLEML